MRLDAGRLPFETGSLAAIHAGAAMHCWPNASLAVRFSPAPSRLARPLPSNQCRLRCPMVQVAEISRVLQPGGVFVASTILNPSSGLGSVVGDDTIRPLKQVGNHIYVQVKLVSTQNGDPIRTRASLYYHTSSGGSFPLPWIAAQDCQSDSRKGSIIHLLSHQFQSRYGL